MTEATKPNAAAGEHRTLATLLFDLEESGRECSIRMVDGDSVLGTVIDSAVGDDGRLVTLVTKSGVTQYIVASHIVRVQVSDGSKARPKVAML